MIKNSIATFFFAAVCNAQVVAGDPNRAFLANFDDHSDRGVVFRMARTDPLFSLVSSVFGEMRDLTEDPEKQQKLKKV